MLKPSDISRVPTAINPPPINRERPPLLLEAAIAASAPGIWSIRAWTLSEGPSLRRKPRTMPMVFSATAPSMPALVASRPTSSSILPRLGRLLPDRLLKIYLDRLCREIQAIRALLLVFLFDRVVSVAPMQERAADSRYLVAMRNAFLHLAGRKV